MVLDGDDDNSTTVPLAFPFHYWSTDYRAGAMININSNGILSMDGLSNASRFPALPSTATPNGVISVHWGDDENRTAQCVATVGTAPSRQQVFEWNDTSICCADDAYHFTYEVILNEAGPIDFLYQTMTGTITRTLGLENPAGTEGIAGCPASATAYTCSPTSGYTVRFLPSP